MGYLYGVISGLAIAAMVGVLFCSRDRTARLDGEALGGAARLFVGNSEHRARAVMLHDERSAPQNGRNNGDGTSNALHQEGEITEPSVSGL